MSSSQELLLKLMQTSMKEHGTLLPPGFDQVVSLLKGSPQPAAKSERRVFSGIKRVHAVPGKKWEMPGDEINWKKVSHKCPRCKVTEGPVDPLFGTRVQRNVRRRQSYCRKCRNELDYHNRARSTRRTKNNIL